MNVYQQECERLRAERDALKAELNIVMKPYALQNQEDQVTIRSLTEQLKMARTALEHELSSCDELVELIRQATDGQTRLVVTPWRERAIEALAKHERTKELNP